MLFSSARVIVSGFLLIFLSAARAQEGEDLRIYYVGNSLTWDAKPLQVRSTLGRAPFNILDGFHLRCGQGLRTIVNETEIEPCIDPPAPYGEWTNALANYEWDAITLQAYPGGNALEELAATRTLIETATAGGRNADCKFFLYLAWPKKSASSTFSERMLTPFRGETERVFLNQGFLDWWYEQVTAAFPNLNIHALPTGIAYASLDEKLREIPTQAYSSAHSLYRDDDHMNTEEGRHLALTMMLCAISGIHPSEQKFSSGYLAKIDPVYREIAEEVAWHTLTTDARSGIIAEQFLAFKQPEDPSLREVSYIGTLQSSATLGSWQDVVGATSPHRFRTDEQSRFFRLKE